MTAPSGRTIVYLKNVPESDPTSDRYCSLKLPRVKDWMTISSGYANFILKQKLYGSR